MKILVFTSKDHVYGNTLLGQLADSGVFSKHDVKVLEQNSVVPGKGLWAGLWRYTKVAGAGYVVSQLFKQFLFLVLRSVAAFRGTTRSPFYPYNRRGSSVASRQTLNRVNDPKGVDQVIRFSPDLVLSLFSKEILGRSILDIPRFGCVNLHPALLPAYKGVSPTFWCLANCEAKSGATLHYMDAGIDTGFICAQEEVSTAGIKTEHALYLQCVSAGASLIIDFLRKLEAGSPIAGRPVVGEGTYFSLPTKEALMRFRRNGFRLFTVREFLRAPKHSSVREDLKNGYDGSARVSKSTPSCPSGVEP